jgi:hypothetical protein
LAPDPTDLTLLPYGPSLWPENPRKYSIYRSRENHSGPFIQVSAIRPTQFVSRKLDAKPPAGIRECGMNEFMINSRRSGRFERFRVGKLIEQDFRPPPLNGLDQLL